MRFKERRQRWIQLQRLNKHFFCQIVCKDQFESISKILLNDYDALLQAVKHIFKQFQLVNFHFLVHVLLLDPPENIPK